MNAKSAKETRLRRTSALEEYQTAVTRSITKKRAYIERLKSSSSIGPEKVDEALEVTDKANKYEQTQEYTRKFKKSRL